MGCMGIGKVTQQFPVCRTTMFDKCEGGRNVGGGWWRRNKAPRTRGGLSICPLHLSVMSAAVSTRNPAPCDLGMAVMKVKANGDMCTRDDDEAMVFERLMQIVYAWGVFLM